MLCDMSAVIHMVKPHRAQMFGEYKHMHLLPFLESQMTNNTTRLDAVWDTYQDASRALGFNRPKVNMYFDLLEKTLFDADGNSLIPPCNIYNVDETGFNICQKSRKIVAKKGEKSVGMVPVRESAGPRVRGATSPRRSIHCKSTGNEQTKN